MKMDYESDKEEAEIIVESIFSKNSAEIYEIKPQKTSPKQMDEIPRDNEDVDEEKNDE